ncbi:hypothetical protein CC85DRAFT_45593 [Cutaneotrichosporon oleaginosum]|uniref:Uncharacterized protein n=1 Tax=Cutaneotrichosporon oleaginosum TaxID=879819 RepID=A0A0J1B7D8_9TREE|nr:uncharacterized protein CC85DRAFT_45593 [Cutaneotrichosporon oleaginosum]KLT43639.1 hypothetical protein CC85DRAFT_45593 [Cutaneotrichosporon oleaginosum]TXT12694.1 hypothetical protein COLE_03104 [Cutaneotrichosporon oleaginosum]
MAHCRHHSAPPLVRLSSPSTHSAPALLRRREPVQRQPTSVSQGTTRRSKPSSGPGGRQSWRVQGHACIPTPLILQSSFCPLPPATCQLPTAARPPELTHLVLPRGCRHHSTSLSKCCPPLAIIRHVLDRPTLSALMSVCRTTYQLASRPITRGRAPILPAGQPHLPFSSHNSRLGTSAAPSRTRCSTPRETKSDGGHSSSRRERTPGAQADHQPTTSDPRSVKRTA